MTLKEIREMKENDKTKVINIICAEYKEAKRVLEGKNNVKNKSMIQMAELISLIESILRVMNPKDSEIIKNLFLKKSEEKIMNDSIQYPNKVRAIDTFTYYLIV